MDFAKGVVELAEDSGALIEVVGVPAEGGGYSRIQLRFANGMLDLSCDDDTDEIVVESGTDLPRGSSTEDVPDAADLLRGTVELLWTMTNHRGYSDAVQIRLTSSDRNARTIQFEVLASAIATSRVAGKFAGD